MIDLKLDDSGDLDTSSGDIALVSGVDAVVQHVRQRFSTIQGEWFADVNVGFPHNELIGERPEPSLVKLLFERFFASCIGVSRIENFSANFDAQSRTYNVSGDIVAVDGEVIATAEPFTIGGL